METKRFSKNDDSFICAHCGAEVKPLGYTSRNHCPVCLWSLHVDENPGDRANPCRGQMEPVSAVTDPKKGILSFTVVQSVERSKEIKLPMKQKYNPMIL